MTRCDLLEDLFHPHLKIASRTHLRYFGAHTI
jgi:hypothetical protein